ncbi:hypothetical protein, partial [Pantoea ananatis]|uniref:hypothetical protein n=1 Tax=Pantoea ananas TaxID=553 RepID=UPI001B302B57
TVTEGVQVSLATTTEESRVKRRGYVMDALHHRRKGNRNSMRAALNLAWCERFNSKYFLGPCPF